MTTATLPSLESYGLEKLTTDEKILLCESLDASIMNDMNDPSYELSDEFKAELDRRIANADANPGSGILLEDFVTKIKTKYGWQ